MTISTEVSTCPIWGDPYKAEGVYHPQTRMFEVTDSPRAFGGYKVSEGLLKLSINKLSDRQKSWLTTWITDQWVLGNDQPWITFEALSAIRRKGALPVHKRADRLLRWITLATHTARVGVNIAIPQNDYGYLAWSESTEWSEVQYLLDYLMEKGWLVLLGYDRRGLICKVTVDGHSRVEELDQEHMAIDSSQAFVAMWFDDSMNEAFENGIKSAIENTGYDAFRIDNKADVDKIDDEIIGEIRRSRFLVADFTHGAKGARGGVYYEAGFAYGLGLPVVRSCRKDIIDKNELHFDVRQHYHVVWETPDELRDGLENRIRALIGEGPNTSR